MVSKFCQPAQSKMTSSAFAKLASSPLLASFVSISHVTEKLCFIQTQFTLEKLPKKLQNWHELKFVNFIKELNNAIKKAGGEKLDDKAQFRSMSLFEEQKAEAQNLKAEIDKTDAEIDAMIYELYGLYGLSEEEIAIVEGSNN
jgi:hypothetical protein